MRHEYSLNTDGTSDDTQVAALKKLLKPRVILVNHEKRLGVDTNCANLAIKFNMIYISVYQLIRQHIEGNTALGQQLAARRKPKQIALQTQSKDEFAEADYSAVHFDLDLVIELIQHTIADVRTNQRFILLEGLCNASKLIREDDRLEMRLMDELFAIEKHIGEVQAIIGLQFNSEKEYVDDEDVEYLTFA